jgi:pyruvate/2-oxoglutarate dehydrogenase complex dihydrolipoamide dehydrogenase (E3) component
MKFDIIVIGSGPAAYARRSGRRNLGFKAAVAEREHVSGICLNWVVSRQRCFCVPRKLGKTTQEELIQAISP